MRSENWLPRNQLRNSLRLSLVFCLALAAFGLTGCAGYRLGPTNAAPAGEKSIRIAAVQNQTPEPRLAEPLTTAFRRQLQQDGTFRLETQGDGDIVLNSVILRYERSGLAFEPEDILTVRVFQISMTARVTAQERVSGKMILNRDVSGRTTVRSGPDLSSAERQALPLLAEDLARNTISLLADGDW